jgi:hypothetical protein
MKTVFQKSTQRKFQFMLNFITLTLSDIQRHSDQDIKRLLLEPFIKFLQRNHSMQSYFWKAEVQDNGNIHFHITTNIYIHHRKVRDAWNHFQKSCGYLNNFQNQFNNESPNSTDIHSVRSTKGIAKYIAGYINKKDIHKKNITKKIHHEHFYHDKERSNISCIGEPVVKGYKRKIEGMIWNCSRNLKKFPTAITTNSNFTSEEISNLYYTHSGKIDCDFATLYIIRDDNKHLTPLIISQTIQQHKENISDKSSQQKFFTVD